MATESKVIVVITRHFHLDHGAFAALPYPSHSQKMFSLLLTFSFALPFSRLHIQAQAPGVPHSGGRGENKLSL